MDWEKKYKEALERAKEFQKSKDGLCVLTAESIFPELAESEDERIRKELIDFILWAEDRGMTRHDYHQAKRPSEWISYLERQKEQKPAEWKPTEEQFNYLAKAIMTLGEEGDCKTAGVLSEIRKGLKCSFPDWKVSPDYPEEGCNVSLNGEIKKIQEWSEEDEKMKERLITRLNWITYNTRTNGTSPNITFFDEIEWLKSLRPQPHWKPSEEQMEALEYVIRDYREDSCNATANYLQEILDHFKNK